MQRLDDLRSASPRGGNRLATGVIVCFLGLQGVAGFKLLCPPKSLDWAQPMRLVCAPALWPFLDYNMYNAPHYEGEVQRRLLLFGVLASGERVPVRAADLGVPYRRFKALAIDAVRDGRRAETRALVRDYEARTGRRLIGLWLESHALVLSGGGRTRGPTEVLRELDLRLLESKP